MDVSERLIVALDFPSVDQARQTVELLDGIVSFFKVGLHLQMVRGTEAFIDELLDRQKRVFIDYKYSDIPETVRGGVAAAGNRGVDFLTVQGSGEITKEALTAAVQGKVGSAPKILLVTLLTSLDARDLDQLGSDRTVEDIVRARANLALDVGVDGVVASGREASLIRALAKPEELLIVTPGIRPVDSSTDDHKRAVAPAEAIEAGADYLVVGRPIVRHPDPRAAAESIIAEMKSAVRTPH